MPGPLVAMPVPAVALLLVAVALALWPVPGRLTGRLAGAGPRAHGRLPHRPWSSMSWRRSTGVVAGVGLLAAATTIAGPSGLLAAAMLLVTGSVLAGRALAERRRRRALPEILRGLRALNRELRAGADPLTAAQAATGACRGAGSRVLGSLVLLMRTGHPAPEVADRSVVDSADPAFRALDFLRSGWLLSRRHGVAFGRVVGAIADELAGQVAAVEARTAQLAGPRMSGYVMAALPVMGVLLGTGMGVDPLAVLLGTPLGNVLLVVGVALMCAGLLWSARIVGR